MDPAASPSSSVSEPPSGAPPPSQSVAPPPASDPSPPPVAPLAPPPSSPLPAAPPPSPAPSTSPPPSPPPAPAAPPPTSSSPPPASTSPPPTSTPSLPPSTSPPPASTPSSPSSTSPPPSPSAPTPPVVVAPPPKSPAEPPAKSNGSPPPAPQSNSSPPPPPESKGSDSPPPESNGSPPTPPTSKGTPPPPPSEAVSPVGSPPPPTATPSPPPHKSVSPPAKTNTTTSSTKAGTSDNSQSASSGEVNTEAVAIVGIVIGFVFFSLLIFGVWFVRRRKRREPQQEIGYVNPSPYASSQNSESLFLRSKYAAPYNGSPPGSGIGAGGGYSSSNSGVFNQSKSSFGYDDLLQATDGFSANNLLGEGGFGCVYKGMLPDGREVAVKQLKIGGNQGEREFRAEVEIISRIHHRHLVSLVGYCIAEHQRLLVYDYVSNNTLDYHLHGEGRPVMDWATRVKVAAGAARGLAYLHEDCHPRIIHRDIKSSNILLDSNFEARVSDFGLAKLAQELDSNTHVSTRVMGTFGYLAPEYATSGKLTEKSDVYSFGVVLLEIITGRKPVDASQPMGEESLVEWARPLLTDALDREAFDPLTDPRLGRSYVASEMFRMIEAAAACVRHSSARRPRMSQVARVLDSLNEMGDLSNGMRPGQSEIFNSRDQSAQIRIFQRLAFGSQDFSSDFYDQSHGSVNGRAS